VDSKTLHSTGASSMPLPFDFSGETVFVIGNGPSAETFGDFEQLRGRSVIVLNAAVRFAPWAPYWASSEKLFWRDFAPELCPDFTGLKLSPHRQPPDLDVVTIPARGFGHLDREAFWGRAWSGTSDYYALQLAYYGRAARIRLIGVDLEPRNELEARIFPQRRERLKWAILKLRRAGVKVEGFENDCLSVSC